MTTSNCMTCIYGGSWCGDSSTEPGYCYMFKDEPDGVCGRWRTSIAQPPASTCDRAEIIKALLECLSGPAALTTREATAIKEAADMLEADGKPKNFLRLRGQLEQEWAEVRALKEASKSKAQQVAVPDGYVLVPIEPTDAMCEAAWDGEGVDYVGEHMRIHRADLAYIRMLAAAQGAKQ